MTNLLKFAGRIRFPLAPLTLLIALAANAQSIPPDARAYVTPSQDGFDAYLIAAIQEKRVPLILVNSPEAAEYEIQSSSQSRKSGWFENLLLGDPLTNEEASVSVVDTRTGATVYNCTVSRIAVWTGKQSTATACARKLKKKIVSGE